ncbi:MAG: methyltransferase domain-containing protein [Salinibacter sp.]|uniref:methyltransferase domain-containing protein n=1 Tax=Salinibacter sp. TaxID=2065818 RepID=UPI0035D485A9
MPSPLPDLSTRLEAEEWMDDFSITDNRLTRTLQDLRWINFLLGGYSATAAALDPMLRRRSRLRIIDLGCGLGDYLVYLVRRAVQFGCSVEAVGLDANPTTVGHARAHLDRHLSPRLRTRVSVDIGDALAPSYEEGAFDVAHAALFLHHFHGEDAVRLLTEMQRLVRSGVLVNDLHRHPLAYAGIWALSRGLGMARMVQHDGPMSVRRGFWRRELETLAEKASLPSPSVRWHWAFRWTLSTIPRSG